jgi:hypothetical protein
MQEINELIKEASFNAESEMDAETAKHLSILLNNFFEDIDITIIRSLQRGNCATLLVTSGTDLLVSKEHLHEQDGWRIPFNVLNDIVMSLFVHEKLKNCRCFPELVSLSVGINTTRIVTKFIPLSFEDIFSRLLPLQFLKQRCKELLVALSFLHRHGFAHRDIKPENIRLRDDGSLVLIDFDTSCRRSNNSWRTKPACSKNTRPPELMSTSSLPYNAQACDIFSAGCTMYAMANDSKLPFGMEENRLTNIRNFKPSDRLVHRLGKDGVNMLQLMLNEFPGLRPTANELLLSHPFFN